MRRNKMKDRDYMRNKVIKRAEEYIDYMITFCNKGENIECNQKAIQDFKDLQAYMSIYKFGTEEYREMAYKWIKASLQ